MRFLRSNSLAIVLAVFFLASVGGQSYSGWKSYEQVQRGQHQPTVSYPRYLVSSDFYDNVMSNWQSEFLQISLYVMFAVWFRQRGSAESQDPDHPVRDSDQDEMLGEHLKPNSPKWARSGGWRLRIYENSLLISKPLGQAKRDAPPKRGVSGVQGGEICMCLCGGCRHS
jgi:hypothetical protein